jgi:DNA-directed RNA polymerase specialized sigma24 family protein
MPWMDSPSEAPGHLREPVGFLPSLAKIIVSADVFIHLLKQLLQSLWRLSSKVLGSRSWTKPLDNGLNDNFIGYCRRLCSQAQEPSDVCLEILLMVLRALKQSLSCNWLRLIALETCYHHILELLP